MKDCIFCKIINREIDSEIIYEDKEVLAFLDIKPTTNGDTLIVPKKHYEDMFDVPRKLLSHMENVYKELYPIYQKKLHCEGLTLTTNMDYGQEIKHFHMHFIPRYPNDKIEYLSDKTLLKDLKEIEKLLK